MRITYKMLQTMADKLNHQTKSPIDPWTKGEDGRTRANIGNYHISAAYGGYALHRTMNEGGGIRDITGGYRTPAELAGLIRAYSEGLRDANA